MIKQTLLLITIICLGSSLCAQNLRSYVIGTYGASKMHDEGAMYISIGEALNTEIEEDGNKIAQGFLQVTIIGKTVKTVDLFDFELKVFPNPVSQYLNIELSDHPDESSRYQLVDQNGRMILSAPLIGQHTQVDFKSLDTGIYYMQLISENKESRVVKIHKQNL